MPERIFTMPDLGEGLEEGKVVAWLVSEGDAVKLNQPLVEVETAKAIVEIPSPYAGVVVSEHAAAGQDVAVGAPLVTFSVDAGSPGRSVAATPAVRRLAKDLSVDLAAVPGSGPQGRVTAEDVRRASGGDLDAAARDDHGIKRVEITPTRRAIAENLSRQAAIPAVTTFRTVDCSALQAFRNDLDVSPLPVFLAALCETIRAHPLLNAGWSDTAILLRDEVDVGIATDTERGLMVPVVRGAGRLGIADLAAQIRRLAEAARGGRLTLEDLSNPTIGVSNTGSYGSEAGTPLLTPGCAVTIALGAIAPRALVVDGEVVARPACTLSLTFDHRVLDGAAAGRALTDLVELLRSPDRLGNLPR
jgi:2-oxoisovalerate dehydrogenase E2 component (dihydrolipoyl transacylase)